MKSGGCDFLGDFGPFPAVIHFGDPGSRCLRWRWWSFSDMEPLACHSLIPEYYKGVLPSDLSCLS